MITLLEESTASFVASPFPFSFTSFMTLMLLPSSAVLVHTACAIFSRLTIHIWTAIPTA